MCLDVTMRMSMMHACPSHVNGMIVLVCLCDPDTPVCSKCVAILLLGHAARCHPQKHKIFYPTYAYLKLISTPVLFSKGLGDTQTPTPSGSLPFGHNYFPKATGLGNAWA